MATPAPLPPKYQDVRPTAADLDYADLVTLDLSLFDTPDGKQQLASQLKTAISTIGFFYVTNFGIDPAKVDEQFEIAQQLFSMDMDAKMKFRVNPERQGFFGYKPMGSRKAQFGLKDNLELYDDPKYGSVWTDAGRPEALEKKRKECEEFGKHLHYFVLYRLLYICGILMELQDPEELWKKHNYENASQCHLRYMLYHPRTKEELEIMENNKLEENVYGHTDFGSLTLLMRQPVAGLQARIDDGTGEKKWKWVRPVEKSLTVNVADTLSFLTGGYLKSTIHRVVLPPEDQRNVPRYGVIYFSGPDDSTLLTPVDSPVLKRIQGEKAREGEDVGLQDRDLPPDTTTAGEWVRVRFGSIDKNYQTNKDNAVSVGTREVKAYA
jgi:isopenicillin N synthase-like dioxygenase